MQRRRLRGKLQKFATSEERVLKVRHLFLPKPGPGRPGLVGMLGWLFYGAALFFFVAGVLSILSGIAIFLVVLFSPLFFVCRAMFYLLARR